MPPLGLVTLAAQLPQHWSLRLVDLNVEPLLDADLEWADVLLLTGMLIHAPSMHQVLARARRAGVRTVVGGPAASTSPAEFPEADHVFEGEAEERLYTLVDALERGEGPRHLVPEGGARPRLAAAPTPRWDLLRRERYVSMSLQYSRGCPFNCEFCDIIEMFGRQPRTKSAAQVIRELEALRAWGWRGSVFFVDDNFIANRKAVAQVLPEIEAWQDRHGRPFELYTEASVDLATQPKLLEAMARAGFTTVFLGIETPSPEALRETQKLQNLRLGLAESVWRVTRAGMEVYAGFIVGFDADGPEVFELQRSFIESLPIAAAMVGILTALPRTQLWRRLEREGRLRGNSTGDQFGRPNFVTALDEDTLLSGYRTLLSSIYSADAYYKRCAQIVDGIGSRPRSRLRPGALAMLLRIALRVGVLSPRRGHFWRLVGRALRRPHTLPRAVALAVQGEHFIRYTEKEVVPRIERALRELRAAPAAQVQARPAPAPAVNA
ncbi:MAG TPA: B12-binding domain-containing radical SAM protein [Myxococcales bacterium]|nr:B12-binding domain-containing radical SAM protein [Myxococcales bacterium]